MPGRRTPDGDLYGGFLAGSMTAVVAMFLGSLDDEGVTVGGSGMLSVYFILNHFFLFIIQSTRRFTILSCFS